MPDDRHPDVFRLLGLAWYWPYDAYGNRDNAKENLTHPSYYNCKRRAMESVRDMYVLYLIASSQNGVSMMQRITATGCSVTALIAAFVDPAHALVAAASALSVFSSTLPYAA